MREAWRPLRSDDNQLEERARTRDPVGSAQREKSRCRAADGTPLRSFHALLEDLARGARSVCRANGPAGTRQSAFELDTQLSADQSAPCSC